MNIVPSVFKGIAINKKMRLEHISLRRPETSILRWFGYIHKEYKDFPLWLRLYVGSGWFSASRQELQKVELFFIVMCLLMLSTWLSNFIWLWGTARSPLLHINIADLFGYSGIICLVGAYHVSTTIRVGDKYDIWSRLAATQSGKFFGLFSPKNKN